MLLTNFADVKRSWIVRGDSAEVAFSSMLEFSAEKSSRSPASGKRSASDSGSSDRVSDSESYDWVSYSGSYDGYDGMKRTASAVLFLP